MSDLPKELLFLDIRVPQRASQSVPVDFGVRWEHHATPVGTLHLGELCERDEARQAGSMINPERTQTGRTAAIVATESLLEP